MRTHRRCINGSNKIRQICTLVKKNHFQEQMISTDGVSTDLYSTREYYIATWPSVKQVTKNVIEHIAL